MGSRIEVPITGPVLEWAIDQAGLSESDIAQRAKVSSSDVRAWINETARPGKTEFRKIVEAVRRPSAIFFMPEAPSSAALPTTFRRSPDGHALSPAAIREVRKARRLQTVLSWLANDQGADPVSLERIHWQDANPSEAGEAARQSLHLGLAEQASWRTPSDALREWRSIYAGLGVEVFSLQLGRDEIRGFSSYDPFVPVVAVNTAYVEGARIFTLAHEFAHLLTRTDSTCNDWVNPAETDEELERWCERFAAAFILPPTTLRSYLSYQFGINENNPVGDFDTNWKLSRRLRVSARAMAISLIDLNLAPKRLYAEVEEHADQVDRRPKRKDDGGGGQPAHEMRVRQYGDRPTRRILAAVSDDVLDERDVADYLGLSIGGLTDLSAYLRHRPEVA